MERKEEPVKKFSVVLLVLIAFALLMVPMAMASPIPMIEKGITTLTVADLVTPEVVTASVMIQVACAQCLKLEDSTRGLSYEVPPERVFPVVTSSVGLVMLA